MSESSYVKRWKSWIGRKKVFSQDELNELETYLIDKMEMLQESNHLSEKESFQQALDAMGESGLLNEEFTKIRKSPFDKVKWWALVQTVVSVLLVVFIFFSQYSWFEKDNTFPYYGDEIGWFSGMLDYFDGAEYRSAVYSDSLFFTRGTDNLIYCFDCVGSNSYESNISINFDGTYNNQIRNKNSLYYDYSYIEEIAFGDEKQLFVVKSDFVIYVFKDNQLVDKIPFPQNPGTGDIICVKVFNDYLLFLFTPNPVINNGELSNSNLFILSYTESSGKKQFQPISLNISAIAMETTEDQIVFLASDGLIQRYTFDGSQLLLKNEQIISNWPKWRYLIPFKMISTNTDQTIVLEQFFLSSYKTNPIDSDFFMKSERYILTSQDNNQLKLISMKDKNIVLLAKIKYRNKKRIAIVSNILYNHEKFKNMLNAPGKINLISDKPRVAK